MQLGRRALHELFLKKRCSWSIYNLAGKYEEDLIKIIELLSIKVKYYFIHEEYSVFYNNKNNEVST